MVFPQTRLGHLLVCGGLKRRNGRDVVCTGEVNLVDANLEIREPSLRVVAAPFKNKQSAVYGRWFARAVTIGKTIDLDELAKHMSSHNTPYSKGAIKGMLTDMVECIRELVLEGKAVKLPNLAIFSAGIETAKGGALKSEDFSTTKHIDSVYLRARATGEFTRQELTKAGNVTELPKNFTDYKDEDDEPTNPSGNQPSNGGGSGSGNQGGNTGGGSNEPIGD